MAKELELWDRGGPPGRGYQQNILSVSPSGAAWRAVYTKVRWDEEHPPYRSDEYTAVLPHEEGASVIALAERAFEHEHDEETDPRVGGQTKLTLTVRGDGADREKTFFLAWPDELQPLRARLEALMARAEAQGEHRIP